MDINEALRATRYEAGRSQEYMANELGITRRTVMNWENGVSEPTISQAVCWFQLTGKNPIPYLLQITYSEVDQISYRDSDSTILKALMQIIHELPAEGVRQLMYLFFGNHGSSPRAVLQMITAHLQCPLSARIAHGQLVTVNYDLAKRTGNLSQPKHIQPDTICLENAITAAKDAVERNEREYVM